MILDQNFSLEKHFALVRYPQSVAEDPENSQKKILSFQNTDTVPFYNLCMETCLEIINPDCKTTLNDSPAHLIYSPFMLPFLPSSKFCLILNHHVLIHLLLRELASALTILLIFLSENIHHFLVTRSNPLSHFYTLNIMLYMGLVTMTSFLLTYFIRTFILFLDTYSSGFAMS